MIAITGGNGPIGKYLIPELLKQGRQLKVLCSEPLDIRDDRLIEIRGDVFNIHALDKLMKDSHVVYHLDCLSTFHPRVRRELYRVNTEGTANVVNLALSHNVEKLLFASTIHSLGDKCSVQPFDESTKWNNIKDASGYGWSMHLAEREVWRGIAEGMDGIIVHAGVIIADPNDSSASNEILNFTLKNKKRYPSGNIQVIDVRDLVKILVRLMDGPFKNEQYITYGHSLSYQSFSEKVARQFSRKPPVKEISYIYLRNRAFFRNIDFLTQHNRPMLSKSMAQVLSDPRSFSNQKISELIASDYIDIDVTIKEYCGLYNEQRSKK